MDDLGSRLNGVLNDPKSMEKIRNLAAMLGLDSSSGSGSAPAPAPPPDMPPSVQEAVPPVVESPSAGLSALSGLQQLDPQMLGIIMKIMPALSSFRQEDDATRLLRAMRPFLGEARRKKLDESLRLMQLVRMVPLLKKGGLF